MRLITILFIVLAVIVMGYIGKQLLSQDKKENGQENLAVGDIAPDFTLKDYNGTPYTLSQFRGKKNVVLYFYPKDDTPGCTKEACSFRDDLSVFDSLNTVVLGVSVDNPKSHKKFVNKYDLNFTLLSDADKKVCNLYNTISKFGVSKRHTFVIDKNGVIQKIYEKVDVTEHSDEVADFIRKDMNRSNME